MSMLSRLDASRRPEASGHRSDMTTVFGLLLARCGLSHREAADVLRVSQDTIKSWAAGRRPPPDGVVTELRALYAKIEAAASQAVELAREQQPDALELGLARSDREARSLGWPCVGAQAAAFGLIAARIGIPVRIAARGATTATAAAAAVHRQTKRR